MKTKKMLVAAGALLLMGGVVMNVKNAMEGHGLLTASLHPSVQAQVGGVNGTTTGFGKQEHTEVKCTRKTYVKKGDASGSGSNIGGSAGAGIGIGGSGWGANFGATITADTTNFSGSFSEEYIEVTEEFMATKYYCGEPAYVVVCSITNPCVQ
ncbi:hypothetical protein [Bacteroides muris (ex Fokt et al. 2023)]|uniref:Uncharacterized protein n=1 Tax=Bacteroides muris (ex Fokt et al. 2023) TaxID=2937417 RepID=A0A9X2NQP3_9BACE|nr:hypothetical protein [Bacteroides muris (ex Fokt et al. 2023)]MCR6504411.1 hypothetical protein [Bacteroides muris (ex Fokt et al. 2023)]